MKYRMFLPLALVVLMVVAQALSGCAAPAAPAAPAANVAQPAGDAAQADAASSEPVELTLSHFWNDSTSTTAQVMQTALDAWQKEHPNVTLNTETMSHDEYYTKFRVLASSNELPDVFIMNADMTTPLSNNGQLLDLTGALTDDAAWRDLQLPGGMVEWARDGKNFGVPAQMIITHVIYYNTAIFEEVGIESFPATLDEFKDVVVKLKEAGYIPVALGAKAGWPLFDCLFGTLSFRHTGLEWYNKLLAHEAKFTDPEFVQVLTSFKEMVDLGAFNDDANSIDNMQARTLYYNRDAAMFMEGNWAIPEGLATDGKDVEPDTAMALWPEVAGGAGKPNEVTWAAGWGWAANNKLEGAEREAAISLIKALSSEDFGRGRLENGELPGQKITEFDGSALPRLFVDLNNQSLNWEAVPILTLGFPASVTDVLWKGLQDIMTGQKSPEEVAAVIQAEYDKYQE